MPTKLKRISISLRPNVEAALNRIHKVTGQSPAIYVSSLISETLPLIEATAEALEIASKNKKKSAKIMGDAMLKSINKATDAQNELFDVANTKK